MLCVLLCCFPRRVAGTSSPPCPRLPRGWRHVLPLSSEVALAQRVPVSAAAPAALAGPAPRTAGSSLIQPQGLAHTMFWSSRRLFCWEVLVPLLGLKKVWCNDCLMQGKKVTSLELLESPSLETFKPQEARADLGVEAVGAEHSRGSFQPVHLWFPFTLEAQAALCSQLCWVQLRPLPCVQQAG